MIFAGSATVVILFLPLFENLLQSYVLSEFGLSVASEGRVVSTDGGEPGMMALTTINVAINLFHILKIIVWMALVVSIIRFLSFLIFSTVLRHSTQSEISSLLRTVISIIIYIVSFFIIFQSQYPGVQLAPLFTGSTIIGIVVGLALQDTLGNLFSGIALQADQPFQVGDVIAISNRGSGVVEAVSWRGVKIRTFQNKLLVMSNSVMGKETIEVAPRDNLNARVVFFSTIYTDSPAKTIVAVREAVRQIDNVSQKIRPVVRIRNLGESGIDWEVKYWAEDYAKHNDTDALIRQRIWYVFNREHIEFSFPTRTVHMEPKLPEITIEEALDAATEHLNNVSIFSPLSDEEIEKLAQESTRRVYAPGEAIVRKGQEGNSMFVVLRGVVNVQLPQNDGVKTINTLRENDYFGEMSLLTGMPRSATVVAAEETEVLRISKHALKPIFEANPELVKSIVDIIEERRLLLDVPAEEMSIGTGKKNKGVLNIIRKFFGLK